MRSGDWSSIENVRKSGYGKAGEYAEKLLSIFCRYKDQPEMIPGRIEEEILTPILKLQ